MKILIAGAGVGGLTAALSLHAAGFADITIAEAAPRFRPLGVGLNILPNAVRELTELGLYEGLAAGAVATHELSYYNRFGSLIWTEPRGLAAGYRWPQLSVPRGHLQAVLAHAVRDRLGPATVVEDSRVTAFDSRGDQVRVILDHRAAGTVSEVAADLLIGADGIHSAIRKQLYPQEGEPPWNGLVVWRGTAWHLPFADGRRMVIAGDDRRRAVVYPMSLASDRADPGEPVLMNWAVARACDDDAVDRADWNRAVPTEKFLGHFADLRFGWLDVPELIRSAETAFEFPMVDRDPLPQWTSGRVTLLGDAAHAMYPMGSNGATQSIVDARVLAYRLARHEDVAEALAAYELDRRPAMTELQLSGRRRGPEVVIDLAHQRAPDGFADIHDVIPEPELRAISDQYARLGAFDMESINHRPSYTPQGQERVTSS